LNDDTSAIWWPERDIHTDHDAVSQQRNNVPQNRAVTNRSAAAMTWIKEGWPS